MQQQGRQDYEKLLKEFIAYRERSVAEKEQLRREVEKCRQQLQKLSAKFEKRVDGRLSEQRLLTSRRLQEQEQQHQQQLEKLQRMVQQKERAIEQIRQIARMVEAEKREMLQTHTAMLVELGQGWERREAGEQGLEGGQRQLLKMYQLLIDENNELKKEMYRWRKQQLTQANQSMREGSLNCSQYQPRSVGEQGKQVLLTNKSQISKERPKEKAKKVTSSKVNKK